MSGPQSGWRHSAGRRQKSDAAAGRVGSWRAGLGNRRSRSDAVSAL